MDGEIMSTLKLIIAGIGTAAGVALMVFLGVIAFKIKDEVHDWRVQQAISDSVRAENEINALQGRLALLDQNAARTKTVFVQAREQQHAVPIVTGGGKKADSIANAAVNACFETATKALTACEVARKTADSLPALKDSLIAARLKLQGLRAPPRWTAKGFVGYAWPARKPMLGVSSDFKVPLIPLNVTAAGDYLIMGSPSTALDSALSKQKWRAYLGASIPFR
jgi:hypothetical protein